LLNVKKNAPKTANWLERSIGNNLYIYIHLDFQVKSSNVCYKVIILWAEKKAPKVSVHLMYKNLRSDKIMLRTYSKYCTQYILYIAQKYLQTSGKSGRPPLRMDLHGHFSARGFANVILNRAVHFKGIMSPIE
jgi:hypothetical protein